MHYSKLTVRMGAFALGIGLLGCTGVVDDDDSGASASGSGATSPGAGSGSGSGNGAGAAQGAGGAGTGASPSGSGGSGTVGPGPGAGGSVSLAPFAPAPQPLLRLTQTQFKNSLKALLGSSSDAELDDDNYIGGFATVGAGKVVTSPTGVEHFQSAIDTALDAAFADTGRRQTLIGCTPQTPLDSACAQSFVKSFGRLAWRKPLTQAQVDRYATVAVSAGQKLSDSYAGLKFAASGLLQSPNFLYRSERGAPVAGAPDRNRYTAYELASKLSFFIWNSTPDAALLDAADAGALATDDGYKAQVERLLAAPQGRQAVANFAAEYLRLDHLDGMAKDAGTYKKFTSTLASAMSTEVTKMWEGATFDADSSILDLLTTPKSFANKELAGLYGLDTGGLSESAFGAVTFPANSGRSGLLTTAALLSIEANQKEGSPTLRGKFLREKFQCLGVAPPPADVSTVLPDPPAGVVYTKREKLKIHETAPSCAGCHLLMDPLGFALEHFDAIGAYRDLDAGKPIDATGSIGQKTFDGALGLGQVLAAAPETATCIVRNFYSYASAHEVAATEEVVLRDLSGDFVNSGHRLRGLILALVSSDAFKFVAPEAP